MEKVSMSHEDYLEAIVMLGGTTENSVRSVDIANKLGVSNPFEFHDIFNYPFYQNKNQNASDV